MTSAQPFFNYDTGVLTHAGRVRKVNEDNYLVEPRNGMWVVADGMGGHENGKLASTTVVEALSRVSVPQSAAALMDAFEASVLSANTHLRDIAKSRGGAVLGSTIAALLTFRGSFACVWSGDSRVYLLRNGRIHQISRDHTEVQELVDRGVLSAVEAKSWPRANVVTRAIGVHDNPELDFEQGRIEDGDRFLLCSDGLTGHVEDAELQRLSLSGEPQSICQQLVDLALERGGKDNVTVILVQARIPSSEDTYLYPNGPPPISGGSA